MRLALACVLSAPILLLRRWSLPVLAIVTGADALAMAQGHPALPLGIVLGPASFPAASPPPRRISIPAALISAAALGGALLDGAVTVAGSAVAVEAVEG